MTTYQNNVKIAATTFANWWPVAVRLAIRDYAHDHKTNRHDPDALAARLVHLTNLAENAP